MVYHSVTFVELNRQPFMNIKILHLLSNWKWTECSEPSVDLALAQSLLGADVLFACGQISNDQTSNDQTSNKQRSDVKHYAVKKGLKNIISLNLPKHFSLFSLRRDLKKLRELIDEFKPDIIHCHMANAHILAGIARGKESFPYILRSCYDFHAPENSFRTKFLYKQRTDGFIIIDETIRDDLVEYSGISPDNILVAEPGIDLNRFSPRKELHKARKEFGLKNEHFVIGVVSRIRQSRRIDIPLGAVRLLAEKFPKLRFFLVGRGRDGALQEVVLQPAQEMGILNKVVLPGYCRGERLAAAYHAMDVLVYPVPGTDKTCRTVREAMASGLPVIAPETGFLPKLIDDRITGRLMKPTAESLADILSELIADPTGLKQMADMAYKTAQHRFSTALQAENVLSFYNKIIKNKAAS